MDQCITQAVLPTLLVFLSCLPPSLPPAVPSNSNVDISCASTAALPEAFTVRLTLSSGPASCQTTESYNLPVNAVCCVAGPAWVRGSSPTSTATCLTSLTATGCSSTGGWLNRFSAATSPSTTYSILAPATPTSCSGTPKAVALMAVSCAPNGFLSWSTVTFAAPQFAAAALAPVTARFYVGCSTINSCTSTSFGGTPAPCTGATKCGGTVSLSSQRFTMPCACNNIRWLYRQASTGFVVPRVNGVCP